MILHWCFPNITSKWPLKEHCKFLIFSMHFLIRHPNSKRLAFPQMRHLYTPVGPSCYTCSLQVHSILSTISDWGLHSLSGTTLSTCCKPHVSISDHHAKSSFQSQKEWMPRNIFVLSPDLLIHNSECMPMSIIKNKPNRSQKGLFCLKYFIYINF